MSWLSQWWDRILQSFIWKAFFGQFGWGDWCIFFLLLLGIVYGIKKGFWKVLSDVLRLMIVLVITLECGGRLGFFLSDSMGFFRSTYGPLIGFIIVGIVSWFLVSWFVKWLRKMLVTKTSALVQVIGGSILGILYFFIFISFVSQIVFVSPWPKVKELYLVPLSYSGKYISETAPQIHHQFMRPTKFAARQIRKVQS